MKKEREFKTSAARCAYEVKQELKKIFPDVKFSVSSDSFSMGDSVGISWEDGPTAREVEEITGKRQYGHFDGMTDMYEYSNRDDSFAQAKYVTTSRKRSAKIDALLPQLEELTKGYEAHDWHDKPDQILYRVFTRTSIPPGAEIIGIERNDVNCGQYDEFFRIVMKCDEVATPTVNVKEVPMEAGEVKIIEYGKGIAVIGDTRPIKDKLGKNGLRGIFQPRLSCGPGWIFPKSRLEEVVKALSEEHGGTTLKDEIQKTVEFFAEHDLKTTGEISDSTKEIAKIQKVSLHRIEEEAPKQYDNLNDIREAANSGKVVSLLNLYNIVNHVQ